MPRSPASFSRALAQLRATGVLLESDAKFPSVVTAVTGKPLRGSWWTHERANEIFSVTRKLADHPDVVVTKLVSKKVTYVHRKLWAALVAIGTSGASWQRRGLSSGATALLRRLGRRGSLRADEYAASLARAVRVGDLVRELETRLLVVTEEVHTEQGAHTKALLSWKLWMEREGFRPRPMALRDAELSFESLDEGFSRRGVLPWS